MGLRSRDRWQTPARLLLLDLTGLSFCDARGLGALVQIANHAVAAGCRYGLIAPQRPVAKMLRIGGLNRRMPAFATIDDALTHLTAGLPSPFVPKPSSLVVVWRIPCLTSW